MKITHSCGHTSQCDPTSRRGGLRTFLNNLREQPCPSCRNRLSALCRAWMLLCQWWALHMPRLPRAGRG